MKITVPGFTPSQCGFHFANSFANVPVAVVIEVLGQSIPLPVLNAANGLCGGMSFAVRDLFESGYAPPADTHSPSSGALFDFIVSRFQDSFNLPLGPLKYIRLMNPNLPDGETTLSSLGLAPHGRAWVMIKEEFPRIKRDIDSGVLCPLGLVFIKSGDLMKIGVNHQVVAYGYEQEGSRLRIFVCDPNFPRNDNVFIELDTSHPKLPTAVTYSMPLNPASTGLHCFFKNEYRFRFPEFVSDSGGLAKSLHLAGTTHKDRLFHTVRSPKGAWEAFNDIEASAGDRGEVVDADGALLDGQLNLVAVTRAGALFHTCGTLLDWQPLAGVEENAGEIGQVVSLGCAAGNGALHLAAVSADGELWYSRKDGTGWSPFAGLRAAAGIGAAVSRADGAIQAGGLVLAVATAAGQLFLTRQTDAGWQAGELIQAQAGPAVVVDAALAALEGELHLCAATADGSLLYTSRAGNAAWSAWADVEARAGERGMVTRVSLAVVGGLLHLAAVNASGRLWHTLRVEDGSWRTFSDVELQSGERGKFKTVCLA